MIIKNPKDVKVTESKDYKGVKKQIFIGPEDGSDEIVMRYFSVAAGGATPYHKHDWPHLVKIEKGHGLAIDKEGNEHPVSEGQLIYVKDNDLHGFKNAGNEAFDFICIVPKRGES